MNALPYLLGSAIWIAPFLHISLSWGMSAHDHARLIELIVLLVIASLGALRVPRVRTGRLEQFDRWALLALAVLASASVLHADLPWVAAREAGLDLVLVSSALLLAIPLRSPVVRWRVLALLAVGGGAYSALWLATLVLSAVYGQPIYSFELLFGFDNPRFLNHVQSMAVPLMAIVACRRNISHWVTGAAWLGMLVCGAMLFLYVARASTLAILVGGTAALVMGRGAARRYVATLAGGICTGALLMFVCWYALLSDSGTTLGQIGEAGQLHFRDYLARQALELFQSSPWVGVGPMHFAHTVNPIAAHPHNVYLQVLAEWGLPATLLIACLVGRALLRRLQSLRSLQRTEPELAAGLLVALVALLVDGAFSGNFVMPLSQLMAVCLIALLTGVHWEKRSDEGAPAARLSRSGLLWRMVLPTTMAMIVAVSVREGWPPADPRIITGQAAKMPIGEQFLNPRYWANGWF